MEDYLKKARELKNRLVSMGETVSDRALTQLVLNGLPRSFESTIQTLTHQTVALSFDKISSSLISESHKRVQRAMQIGEEDALSTSFQQQNLGYTSQYQGQGGRQGFRGRYQGCFQSPGRFLPSSRFPSPNRFPSPGHF